MRQSRREIVDEACLLVEQLTNGRVSVKRTVWSSILADFMASPDTDASMPRRKLQDLMRQMKKGNGGHLNRNPQEYRLAVEVIEKVLADESRSLEELRMLFGWTGRLLHNRMASPNGPNQNHKPAPGRGEGAGLNEGARHELNALMQRLNKKK